MPFCPACRSEYRSGFNRCADCDVDLVEALAKPPQAPDPGGLRPVYSTVNFGEA